MDYYVGVDLGGTNIRTGVVDENYNVISIANVKTNLPQTPEKLSQLIAKSIFQAVEKAGKNIEEINSIGIGMPGIIDPKKGVVTFASNFDFNNVALAEILQKQIGIDVYLENDANSAVLGEMLDGSAKGAKDVVMLTLGTGVGGGIIIDGSVYSGFNSLGAELGHVGIFYGGLPCLCGHTGCVEVYCSATALINQTRKAAEADEFSIIWEMVSNDLSMINGKTAFDAKRQGDKTGAAVVEQYVDYLSYAVANYINIFQPEILILAGGISHEGETLVKPIKEYVKKHGLRHSGGENTRIVVAKLGGNAGLIGAAFLHSQVQSKILP